MGFPSRDPGCPGPRHEQGRLPAANREVLSAWPGPLRPGGRPGLAEVHVSRPGPLVGGAAGGAGKFPWPLTARALDGIGRGIAQRQRLGDPQFTRSALLLPSFPLQFRSSGLANRVGTGLREPLVQSRCLSKGRPGRPLPIQAAGALGFRLCLAWHCLPLPWQQNLLRSLAQKCSRQLVTQCSEMGGKKKKSGGMKPTLRAQ